MATINLGSIKFNWQGAYSGSTAYSVDDVVSYNGSSYICKLASTGNLPTNTTYWDQMSQAGTDGTDLTSTLTTQGDIVYRNASGLARLAAGTSGQVLQTGGSGANPSWADAAGGGVLQVKHSYQYISNSTSSTSYVDTGQEITITPTASNSKILLMVNSATQLNGSRALYTINKSGDTSGNGDLHTNIHVSATGIASMEGAVNRGEMVYFNWLDRTVASTNALTYKVRYLIGNSGNVVSYGRNGDQGQHMYAIEFDGGIVS